MGATAVWRSLSWANLHLIPNLHLLSFLYDTHILLPPIWDGLACIVRGTCFCRALSFWSASALKGFANTLLSEPALRGGGGSLLWVSEPREGAGRVGGQAADDPAVKGRGGSGSSSSASDSLPESLEAEPDSSKKLRVFLTDVASSPSVCTELGRREKEQRERKDMQVKRARAGVVSNLSNIVCDYLTVCVL